MDPADILPDKNALGKNRSKEKQYAFDYAFDKDTNQHDVFLHTTKFLCDGVLNGYNATVFAYGATGAGKTYTYIYYTTYNLTIGCWEQKKILETCFTL